MTTDDLIARFEREYQQYHQITTERASQQRRLLAQFAATLDGRTLAEADADALRAFAGDLLASGYHVNTVRKKLNMIRPFYSWAWAVKIVNAEQYLELKSVRNPRGATGNSEPNPYSREELTAFWTALDERLPPLPAHGRRSQALSRWISGKGRFGPVRRHAMRLQIEAAVRLALDCGARRHEMFGFGLDDLHYDNAYLVIVGKADPHTGQKKTRSVPYTDDAREAAMAWLEFRALLHPQHERPWVSIYSNSDPGKPMWVTRFNMLLQQAVGPEWRWHRFRHTCATEWLRAGMEIEYVQKLMGHSTIQQTLAYAKIAKGDLARRVERHQANFSRAVSRRAA